MRCAEARERRRACPAATPPMSTMPCSSEIFGALKAFRRSVSRIVSSITRGAGKAYDRARLGDMDVAEHGEGTQYAAGRRIGQDDDIGRLAASSRSVSTAIAVRGICISDSMPSCMRAPPEAVPTTSAACEHSIAAAAVTMRLARRDAHRAAQEAEIEHRRDASGRRRLCRADYHRIGPCRSSPRTPEPVGIAFRVAKL